jgi:glycosyltransferase involved in cell wall biosynthesis
MRVAFDGRTICDHFPGIGRYAYNLASALARTRPELELHLLYHPGQPNTRYPLEALRAQANVRLVPVDAPNFAPSEQWRLPGVVRATGAQVYHSPYYVMPYRPGLPTVVTIHDLIPLIKPAGYSARARLLFALTVRLAAWAATRIISVSRASAADLQARLGVQPSKVVTVLEAADPSFSPQPAEAVAALRQRLGLPEAYVLYLGGNKPHKNLERLVRAYLRLADAPPLVIAGQWEARYPEARNIVAQAGAESRVKFMGPVAAADVPALYSGATLFVFPSVYEGFGLPPLEAMACGAPVACSHASSLPEAVGEAALLFDPWDEGAITAALQRALGDQALRAELGRRGLARAAQLTWEAAAQQTAAVYAAALSGQA